MRPDNPVIAIVHSNVSSDAPADEQDTLAAATMVQRLFQEDGKRAVCIPYRPACLAHDLESAGASMIFNLVESIDGRGDNTDQATDLFTRLGYAFTGTGSEGLRNTTDKFRSRDILRGNKLPVPDFMDETAITAASVINAPFIIKSRFEEGSFGIFVDSIVNTADDLREILQARKTVYGGKWFAEQYVEGREFHVSLLGAKNPCILPIAEIDFSAFPSGMPHIIDYAAKWDEDSFQYNNTPYLFSTVSDELRNELEIMAAACWEAFDLNGSARIDFRIGADGAPYIIDINANPCLQPYCVFYAAARKAGLEYSDILNALLSCVLSRASKEHIHA